MKTLLKLTILLLLVVPFTCVHAEKLTQKDVNIALNKGVSELKSILLNMDMDAQYIEYLKEHKFNLDKVMPDAITIGALLRCQNGIGMCGGEQVNIAKENGRWIISTYTLIGVQAGLAEMYKLEFYIAACYGSCIGINAEGFFAGIDGMVGYGVGGGFFIDVGVDATEVIMYIKSQCSKVSQTILLVLPAQLPC